MSKKFALSRKASKEKEKGLLRFKYWSLAQLAIVLP